MTVAPEYRTWNECVGIATHSFQVRYPTRSTDVPLRLGRQIWDVECDRDGAFRFDGLPPGAGTVHARWRSDDRLYRGRVEVDVGSEAAVAIPIAPTK